jgi:hypothetical protein
MTPTTNKTDGAAAVGSTALLGIWSVIFNSGIPLAAWFAVHGDVPCGYITKFMAAITAAITPLVVFAMMNPGKPARLREWSSHVSDAATVSILVWHGWLWCAGGFTFGWIGCFALFAARRAQMPNGTR